MMVETFQYWHTPPLPILACGIPSASELLANLSREDPKICAVKFQEEALDPGSVLGTGVQQQRCERQHLDTEHFRSVNRALHNHNALVSSALILGLQRMQYGCAKPRRALQRLLPRHRMLGLAFVLCCMASSIMVVGSEGAQGIQPWPTHWLEQCFAALALLPAALLLNRALC